MSAHTPGPWFAERFGSITADVAGARRQVASATGEAVMHGPSTTSTSAIQEANARLIAAAPDLLAALVGLTTQPIAKAGWSKSWDDAMGAARVAIAKAEGKS